MCLGRVSGWARRRSQASGGPAVRQPRRSGRCPRSGAWWPTGRSGRVGSSLSRAGTRAGTASGGRASLVQSRSMLDRLSLRARSLGRDCSRRACVSRRWALSRWLRLVAGSGSGVGGCGRRAARPGRCRRPGRGRPPHEQQLARVRHASSRSSRASSRTSSTARVTVSASARSRSLHASPARLESSTLAFGRAFSTRSAMSAKRACPPRQQGVEVLQGPGVAADIGVRPLALRRGRAVEAGQAPESLRVSACDSGPGGDAGAAAGAAGEGEGVAAGDDQPGPGSLHPGGQEPASWASVNSHWALLAGVSRSSALSSSSRIGTWAAPPAAAAPAAAPRWCRVDQQGDGLARSGCISGQPGAGS